MVWLDWLLIALIALSMITAFFRGVTRELIGLLAWALGAYLAFRFAPELQSLLENQIETPEFRYALVFVAVLILFVILGAIIGVLSSRFIKGIGLAGLDRTLGIIFGLARGLLVVLLFIMIASFTPLIKKDEWKQSWLVAEFETPAEELLIWLEELDLFPKMEPKETPADAEPQQNNNVQPNETVTNKGN